MESYKSQYLLLVVVIVQIVLLSLIFDLPSTLLVLLSLRYAVTFPMLSLGEATMYQEKAARLRLSGTRCFVGKN